MCDINNYQQEYTAVYKCLRTPPNNRGYNGPSCRYLLKKEGENPLIIIGCNPSDANEGQSDQTMIKVSKFCQIKGYGGYIMLNLYPQIATRVGALPPVIDPHIHAVNMEIIRDTLENNENSDVLFAFGGLIEDRNYLPNPCYLTIINIVNNIINPDRLKRLSLNNHIFEYPLHFGYRRITNRVIEEGRLGLVEFNF